MPPTTESVKEKIAEKLSYLSGSTVPFNTLPDDLKKEWYIDADAILSIFTHWVEEKMPKKKDRQPTAIITNLTDVYNEGFNKAIDEMRQALKGMEGK